jgi:hypothetical protein
MSEVTSFRGNRSELACGKPKTGGMLASIQESVNILNLPSADGSNLQSVSPSIKASIYRDYHGGLTATANQLERLDYRGALRKVVDEPI